MNSEYVSRWKRSIKRFLYSLVHALAPKEAVDYQKMDLAAEETAGITRVMRQYFSSISWTASENKAYFIHLTGYIGKGKFLLKNLFFLYPPNIAVMDFLLKQSGKNDTVIDYGCGLGNLLVYLKALGFTSIWGYDNFSQVSGEHAMAFLGKFNCRDSLCNKDSVLQLRPRVVICSGYFWDRLDRDIIEKEKNNSNLEYMLIDYDYAPLQIPNFKVDRIYPNLLVVFKRIL